MFGLRDPTDHAAQILPGGDCGDGERRDENEGDQQGE